MTVMLTDVLGASFLVGAFALCVLVFRLVPATMHVLTLVGEAFDVVADIDLHDREKEKAVQVLAFRLLARFTHIVLGSAMCVIVPLAALWAFDKLNWLDFDSVLALTLSWQFITGTVVIFAVFWKLKTRFTHKEPQSAAFENRYSALDQILHQAAFATRSTQIGLVKLEDILFPAAIAKTPQKPIFIAALPRAGTTLLLNLLYETGEFSTHTYRQMPFLLTPLLWDCLSKRFRKRNDTPRERAHGDRVLVSIDSPEAFEEVVWYSFWQKHYQKNRIMPWAGKNLNKKFDEFYRQHISKIIYLNRNNEHASRYISKNYLNIARIPYLKKLFPDSIIIVPIRNPLDQASSLLHQHKRFSSIHKDDEFARRYMRDIGHFDFGENLKPVQFSGTLAGNESELQPDQLGFWLEYWLLAYSSLLERKAQIQFFNYDHFCSNSQADAEALGNAAGINNLSRLKELAKRVSQKKTERLELTGEDAQRLRECMNLHTTICELSVNREECSKESDVIIRPFVA